MPGLQRPRQGRPFALLTYEAGAGNAASDLASVTPERRQMPPAWPRPRKGAVRSARVLPEARLKPVSRWAERAVRRGSSEAPTPRTWIRVDPGYARPCPDGPGIPVVPRRDELRRLRRADRVTEGRWVAAVDFQPANRRWSIHPLRRSTSSAAKRSRPGKQAGYKALAGSASYSGRDTGAVRQASPGLADGVWAVRPAGSTSESMCVTPSAAPRAESGASAVADTLRRGGDKQCAGG